MSRESNNLPAYLFGALVLLVAGGYQCERSSPRVVVRTTGPAGRATLIDASHAFFQISKVQNTNTPDRIIGVDGWYRSRTPFLETLNIDDEKINVGVTSDGTKVNQLHICLRTWEIQRYFPWPEDLGEMTVGLFQGERMVKSMHLSEGGFGCMWLKGFASAADASAFKAYLDALYNIPLDE